MKLKEIKGAYGVYRYSCDAQVPTELFELDGFVTISKTEDELSVVCPLGHVDIKDKEEVWRILRVEGQLDFALTGILYSITKPLAEGRVSLFAISTFDTDYIMIKEEKFEKAISLLQGEFEIELLN